MNHKGFKCLSSTGRLYIFRHVMFNESEFPFKGGFLNTKRPEETIEVIHMVPLSSYCENKNNADVCSSTVQEAEKVLTEENIDSSAAEGSEAILGDQKSQESNEEQVQNVPAVPAVDKSSSRSVSTHPMVTRLKSGAIQPKSAYVGLTKLNSDVTDPCNALEAYKVPHWKKAMEVEFEALKRNSTWELVPYKGQSIVDCK